MVKKSMFEPKFKRRSAGTTNYKKRLALLKSGKPRLVVRKTNRYIIAQILNYALEGDVVMACANSSELEKFGWGFGKKNLCAAYLTGLLIAQKAKKKNVAEAIFDIGLQNNVHGGRVFAVLKGALDAGMKIAHEDAVLPSAERISGKHIENYAKAANAENKLQFSKCIAGKMPLGNISGSFESAKKKIIESEAEQK